jgi:uncharacterized integral membrane protein
VAQVTVILSLLFAVLIAVFAVQNTDPVSVRFLMWGPATMAASVLVLISAALAALAMLLMGTAREVQLRWAHHNTSSQLKTSQKRVAQLEAAQAAAAPAPADVPAAESAPAAAKPTKP